MAGGFDASTMVNDAITTLSGTFAKTAQAGRSILTDLGRRAGDVGASVLARAGSVGPSMQTCCCGTPEPCWYPHRLPDVVSAVCPGAIARVRIRVTNCGLEPRTVILSATGDAAKLATGEPSTVTIGPFDRAELAARIDVPDGADNLEMLLWVQGCRTSVLRWIVKVSDRGCSTTHQVDVDDCPRVQHRWHDHFWCPGPCEDRNNG